MGYTGPPQPCFPYVPSPFPEPPSHGKWPVASYHTTVQDLLLGISADQSGGPGLGIGCGTVGRTVELKWEQRLNYSLFDASMRGDASLVRAAIEQKANPNTRMSDSGATPLHLAAIHADSPEVIELLLRCKASIDAVDSEKVSPLLGALQAGHSRSAVSLLHLGADPKKLTDPASRRGALNALLSTCPSDAAEENAALTLKLVQLASSSSSSTAQAAAPASFWGTGSAAPSSQPSQEQVKNQMRTSVMTCVVNNWFGGLSTLLAASANANATDKKSRRSALEWADALLNHEIANLLRSYGAAERQRSDHEQWALCLACASGDWGRAVWWGRAAELDFRETPPSDRLTALQYAAVEGHGDIARMLIKAGHSVDLLEKGGVSAAGLARKRGHRALAAFLQKSETESLWRRSKQLATESWRGGEAKDFMPSTDDRRDDGRSWHVLRDLLMPHPADEIPWTEADTPIILSQGMLTSGVVVDDTRLKVTVVSCRNLEAGSFNWSLDPFVKVWIRKQAHHTSIIPTPNPMFNTQFLFTDVKKRDVVTCTVWDKAVGLFGASDEDEGDDLLGRFDFPLMKHFVELHEGKEVIVNERLLHQLPGGSAMIQLRIGFVKL